MKIAIYTTLLLAFTFFVQPCQAQNNKDRKSKDFYKSANQAYSANTVKDKKPKDPDVKTDTVPASELGSLMKDLSGVTDITKDGKSVLNPTVSALRHPKTAPVEPGMPNAEPLLATDRPANAGKKGKPEPAIPGIPNLRSQSNAAASAPVTTPAVPGKLQEEPLLAVKRASNVGRGNLEPKAQGIPNTRYKGDAASATPVATGNTKAEPLAATASDSQFRAFNDADWKLIRTVNVSLADQADGPFIKKYAVVLGTFKSQNNANFVKRTFNNMGESSIIVKGDQGAYYTLLGSFDNETEAIQKLEEVNRRYVDGVSRTRRISRFGVALDDLWILKLK